MSGAWLVQDRAKQKSSQWVVDFQIIVSAPIPMVKSKMSGDWLG